MFDGFLNDCFVLRVLKVYFGQSLLVVSGKLLKCFKVVSTQFLGHFKVFRVF